MKNILIIGWKTLCKPSGYYSLGALVTGGFIAATISFTHTHLTLPTTVSILLSRVASYLTK